MENIKHIKIKVRKCFRGHIVLKEKNRELKKTYSYYCPKCDENMFEFETYIEYKKWGG